MPGDRAGSLWRFFVDASDRVSCARGLTREKQSSHNGKSRKAVSFQERILQSRGYLIACYDQPMAMGQDANDADRQSKAHRPPDLS